MADRQGSSTPDPGEAAERATPAIDVLLVAAGVVAVVALAAFLTGLLPDPLEEIVYTTPLAIGVLIVGTGLVLYRVSRRQRS